MTILDLNMAPKHQKEILGIEPYYCQEGKMEAYNHLVATRYEWLISFPMGTDELISEMSYDFLGPNVRKFIHAASGYIKDGDTLERIGFGLGSAFHFEAERQAFVWARQHIDEVWSRRGDPDFSLDQL